MTTEKKKSCSKCGETYPANKVYFRTANTCINGLSNICRKCFQKQIRGWKLKTGLVSSDHQFPEYNFSVDRIKLPKLPKFSLKRYQKYSSDIIRTAKILRQGILKRSREKKLTCDKDILTIDYFCERLSQNSVCECCGRLLNLCSKAVGVLYPDSATVDRVNINVGYIIDNVSILCWKCNAVKKDASLHELEQLYNWMIYVKM